MKNLIVIFAVLISAVGMAQDLKVQGKVLDGAFGDAPLAFASVQVKGLDITAETSLEGFYELDLLEGNYTFVINFTGYKQVEIENVEVRNTDIMISPVSLKALRLENDDVVSVASGE